MSDIGQGSRTELLAAYDSWHAARHVMGSLDGHPTDGPVPSDWAASDDAGVDLLHELASSLRLTEECGHGSAEVIRRGDIYRVVCADCDTTWDKSGDLVPK